MSTPVSKILKYHIIKSYLLERQIYYTSPLIFSFPTATDHWGAASSAITLSEAATRGIVWKKVFLKILQNF